MKGDVTDVWMADCEMVQCCLCHECLACVHEVSTR